MNRLRLFARASTRDVTQRPNDEISDRVQQHASDFGGGVDLRMLSKGTLRLEMRRDRTGFDKGAFYQGFNLNDQLNRTTDVAELSWRDRGTITR